jgi:hypothetical protein
MAATRPVAGNGAHPEFYLPQHPGPSLRRTSQEMRCGKLAPLTPFNPPPGSPVEQLPLLGSIVDPLQQTSPLGSIVP